MKSKKIHYYLVINLGLRSIRVILFNDQKEIVEKNWYPVQTTIENQKVEQNPNEWWELCEQLLDELFLKKSEYSENLEFITVTSSANCLVMLDKSGVSISNSYIVSDKRAVKQAQFLTQDKNVSTLFTNPNFLPNPSYMFPKMLWLKENDPKLFRKVHYFMGANDFLIHKLTGHVVSDHLNAEKFYYDFKLQTYPRVLMRELSITPSQLPKVVGVGQASYPLLASFRKNYSLSPKVRVVITSYDAICAFIGSGALSEGESCNVTGTVSSIRVYTQKKIKANNGILNQSFGKFSIVGGSNNIDGGLLEWAKHMFYGDSYPEKYVYKIMEDEAQESTVGSHGLFFLPYIIGERFPFFDAHARGMFFGLERFHKRNDIMRSIFEASSFMAHDSIQAIEKYGINVSVIRMSGGMARNNLICRVRADITGKKVFLIDEVEITSFGALFIMLKSVGIIKNYHAVADVVAIKETFIPRKEHYQHYQEIYTFFKKLYESTKHLMVERNQLLDKLSNKEKFILENL